MAVEKVRDFFGLKYIVIYDIDTKQPKVLLRAGQDCEFTREVESIPLTAGDSEGALDNEFGQPVNTFAGTVKEYPKEVFSVLEQATVTTGSAESDGALGSITEGEGDSIYDLSNGISAVAVKTAEKDNLIHGMVVLKATGANTLTAYAVGNIDPSRIVDLTMNVADDTLGTAISIDCSTPGTVDIDELGIQITVVGTAAFDTGDTIYFDSRPANSGYEKIEVGNGSQTEEFGVLVVFPRKQDGVMHYIDIPRVSGRGLPWRGESRAWSEWAFSWTPLIEAASNILYTINRLYGV